VYFNFVSRFTPKPMPTLEAVCRGAAQATLDMAATIILVITSSLEPVTLVAKYRPLTPIVVATNSESVRSHSPSEAFQSDLQ
jgi:pyruvate kinase